LAEARVADRDGEQSCCVFWGHDHLSECRAPVQLTDHRLVFYIKTASDKEQQKAVAARTTVIVFLNKKNDHREFASHQERLVRRESRIRQEADARCNAALNQQFDDYDHSERGPSTGGISANVELDGQRWLRLWDQVTVRSSLGELSSLGSRLGMPRKQKINLEKVKAALNTVCAKCGYAIPPDKIRRVNFDQLECPECGQRFAPRSTN
jgi:predicted RNA-binding Zn-ribbon protein involved in translation (DUF1610 family)